MKTTFLLSLITLLFIQSLPAAESQGIRYTKGPELFRKGDAIQIKEVQSKSGTFEVGDEVIVRGVCDLQSKPEAKISLFVTASVGEGKNEILPGQQLTIAQGKREFELKTKIWNEGFLHVSFYPANGGS